MEPISIIMAALAAGAAAGATEVASQAIKDAYEGLKALVLKRFEGKPAAETALVEYEQDADTWEKPLQKSLVEAGADKEQEIVDAAQKVLQLVQPQQVAKGKYNVQIGTAQGVVIGDHATVEQRFGRE
jgi:hypothetical protein